MFAKKRKGVLSAGRFRYVESVPLLSTILGEDLAGIGSGIKNAGDEQGIE